MKRVGIGLLVLAMVAVRCLECRLLAVSVDSRSELSVS